MSTFDNGDHIMRLEPHTGVIRVKRLALIFRVRVRVRVRIRIRVRVRATGLGITF